MSLRRYAPSGLRPALRGLWLPALGLGLLLLSAAPALGPQPRPGAGSRAHVGRAPVVAAPAAAPAAAPRPLQLVGQVGGHLAAVAPLGEHVVAAIGSRLFVLRADDVEAAPIGFTAADLRPISDLITDPERNLAIVVGPHERGGLLRTYDLSDPEWPRELGAVSLPEAVLRLERSGEVVWARRHGKVFTVDVADPAAPVSLGWLAFDGRSLGDHVFGLSVDPTTGIGLINLRRIPPPPTPRATPSPRPPPLTPGPPPTPTPVAAVLLTTPPPPELWVFDARDPRAPRLRRGWGSTRPAEDEMHVVGDLAVIGWGDDLSAYDLSNPDRMRRITQARDLPHLAGGEIEALHVVDGRIWIAHERGLAEVVLEPGAGEGWRPGRSLVLSASDASGARLARTARGDLLPLFFDLGVARVTVPSDEGAPLTSAGWLPAPAFAAREVALAAGRVWAVDRRGAVRETDPLRPDGGLGEVLAEREAFPAQVHIHGEGYRLAWSHDERLGWADLATESVDVVRARRPSEVADGEIWQLDGEGGRVLAVSPFGSHLLWWEEGELQRSPRLPGARPMHGRLSKEEVWLNTGIVMDRTDVSDPRRPRRISEMNAPGGLLANDLEPGGADRLWLSISTLGLLVLDVGDPDRPRTVGRLDLPGARHLHRDGWRAWATWSEGTGHGGVALLDLSRPDLPDELGRATWSALVGRPLASGDCVFVPDMALGVLAFALREADAPVGAPPDPAACRLDAPPTPTVSPVPRPASPTPPRITPAAPPLALPWLAHDAKSAELTGAATPRGVPRATGAEGR